MREGIMPLEFVGIDPDTGSKGSPMVWVEDETQEIVIQGWKAGAVLEARICGTEWVAGHARGIPDSEAVIRIPARMVPILREACDVAEHSGLRGADEDHSAQRGSSGNA
jgi:hypothetical protein